MLISVDGDDVVAQDAFVEQEILLLLHVDPEHPDQVEHLTGDHLGRHRLVLHGGQCVLQQLALLMVVVVVKGIVPS